MGQCRSAERNHRGGCLLGWNYDIWRPDRSAEFAQRQRSAPDRQRELRLLRSGERSNRECSLQLGLSAGSGRRRVGVCFRRETKARRAAMRDLAPRLMASASAPMPLHPTTLPLGEPISPMRIRARPIHIGVRPIAQPTARPSRTFRRSRGTTRARVRFWRFLKAIRLVMAPAVFVEATWRNNTGTLQWARAAGDQAGARPALRRQIWWSAAVARDTPNLRGKRGCPGSRTMASGTFPTYRSSPVPESGTTTTWAAFPMLRISARSATAHRL